MSDHAINTLRVHDELRAYLHTNNITRAKLSVDIGKGHSWISEVFTGRKGAHLAVLATQDRIEWPDDLIEWASRVRAENKLICARAPHQRAKCPVAADAHPWHGVKLHPIAAQLWR